MKLLTSRTNLSPDVVVEVTCLNKNIHKPYYCLANRHTQQLLWLKSSRVLSIRVISLDHRV